MTTVFFYTILALLIFNFLLDNGLSLLDYRYPQKPLPDYLTKIYDKEKYAQSQAYEKEKRRLNVLVSVVQFLFLLSIFILGGFGYLDQWVRTISNHYLVQNLLFFGVLILGSSLLSLPVSYYHTFHLETRYGFNKTTFRTFILDQLKSGLLVVLLGGSILSFIVWVYHYSGSDFWWITWLFLTAISLLFTAFYSELIVPLFNKQSPLEEGSLRDAIETFAKRTHFKLTNIYTIDGSKRSTKANAYFSGLGPRKRIVLYDTLIEDLENDELVAVLAHEIGHYKKKHALLGLFLSALQSGLMLFILSFFIAKDSVLAKNLAQAVAGNDSETLASFYLGIIGFGMIYSPISLLFGLFFNAVSRRNEYAADHFAVSNGKGEALGWALIKLTVNNLSKVDPHPAYIFFHYSHPSLKQRLKRLDVKAFK
jgi:STE24 endopeptidase